MTERALAVIPARLDASRLPGKPLLDLGGRPVLQWVWEAAVASGVFDEVVVATPDEQVAQAAIAFGAVATMTRADHMSGTDRVAEVARRYDHSVVANVQGDQPFVTTEMLGAVIGGFTRASPRPQMTTVATRLADREQFLDPSTVKVVVDRGGDALYFSRAAIPFGRSGNELLALHHLGLYAFDRAFLDEFARLEPGALEQMEGLEQLRALEHGYRIRVEEVSTWTLEINTPSDLEEAQALVSNRRQP